MPAAERRKTVAVETLGGYRIIRKLGSGHRSDVYLGHAGDHAGVPGSHAAIKVFRDGVSPASIGAEIDALSALDVPHIVRLLDLASRADSPPCLILQRLFPGGLARLLVERPLIAPGEAVTILAPVATAVAAMHRQGVSHRGLSARSVLFDLTGAPVLVGFGAAGFIGRRGSEPPVPADLDQDAGVRADLDALAVLARSVLSRVDGGARSSELCQWLAEEGSQLDPAEFGVEVVARLFALAEPLPVDLSRIPTAADGVPARLGHDHASSNPSFDEPDAHARVRAGHPWVKTGSRVLPESIRIRLELAGELLSARAASLPAAITAVRRRVWVVAGCGLAAILAAVSLAQAPAGITPAEEVTPAPTAPVITSTVITGEDPVAAVAALLALRSGCFATVSVLCLDGVDEYDSAAWLADAESIRRIQDGGEFDPVGIDPRGVPVLVDRLGDSALVALSSVAADAGGNGPASVLVVRTEAGWRIRSLMSGQRIVSG